jgi:hypothetical protein
MAASTTPSATTTEYPQPWPYTPAMIRNSPAKVAEPGTASAIIPPIRTTVASVGRPRAIPPSSSSSPVPQRRSTIPTRRNMLAEMSPCATDWRMAPSMPRSSNANTPSVMSPI